VGLLGVGSLPGLLFCGLGAVLGVIALVLAPEAEREILASDGEWGGLSVIRVARICARLSIAGALIGLAIGIGMWFWFLHWAHHHQAH
jgi:hypothetical protein